jgi:energy-coupling factor transporter ATP-binding protein EcfA2
MAYIERIEVENEGFLSGLDVTLKPGLNVLIGARGTGKTSIIELIRYALSAQSFTTEAGTKGQQQAVATLDGGAVTLTVREGDSKWVVTRTAQGVTTTAVDLLGRCTVLAQNEVESIGVSPTGRLALIDRFLSDPRALASQIRAASDTTASMTSDIATALSEIEKSDDALAGYDDTERQLLQAKEAQEALLSRSNATASDQQLLTNAQSRLSLLAQRENQLAFALAAIQNIQVESASLVVRLGEVHRDIATVLPASASNAFLEEAEAQLSAAANQLPLATAVIRGESETVGTQRAELDTASRAVRQRLELAQEGLSQATRRVQQLQEQIGQLDALRARRAEAAKRLDVMRDRRREVHDELSELLAARLAVRQHVADSLTRQLAPHIRVRVTPGMRLDAYTSGIIASLRGSGLHYNNLAPLLANSVAPSELVDWVERSAAEELAQAIGVQTDRAAAIVNAIRQGGTASIISAHVEDEVFLELLDGPDYKPIEHLSIGQRCTVILPILLALGNETLVVDQPEDHLDNAFITSTLLPSVRARNVHAQTIFSSHNANIPVLGDAAHVVVMDSDGEAGHVTASGALEDPRIVNSISEIMEGGTQAFAARARFYDEGGAGI